MAIITSTSFKGTTTEALAAITNGDILESTKVTITDNAYEADNLINIIAATNNHPVVLQKTAADTPLTADSADLVTIIEGVNKYTGSLSADDPATAEQLNIIAKGTTGKVTAILDETTELTKATVDALADVKATDVITFAPTATTADAAILVAINKIISGTNFAAVTTIEADAADVALVKEALTYASIDNPAVTITGAISAADVNAIAKETTGAVTATVAADTAAKLVTALEDVTDGLDVLTLTVNGATAAATDLNDLMAKTAVAADAIKVDAKEITGAGDALAALYENTKFANLGNENVKIDDGADIEDINTVLGKTTGVVTATVTADTASALNTALGNAKATDALTLTVNDDAAATDAAVLLALDDKTSVAVDASLVTEITGSAADIKTVLAAKTITTEPDVDVTIDPLTGDISAADANAIAKATDGKLTATIKDGSVAATLKALSDVKASDALTFTSTDKTVKASDLVALNSKIANGTYTSIETITGDAKDAADIATALAIPTIKTTNPEVKISGIIDSADITAILTATDGKVTAKIKADTAVKLATNLADDTDVNALDVTVNGGTAAAADLKALTAVTTVAINANSVKTITAADVADVVAVYAAAASKQISGLGNEIISITGPISAADANTLAGLTSGKVVAAVAPGAAADLLEDLANANAKDELSLTVTGASTAKDLLALDAKTALAITLPDTAAISGTAAEIKKVYASKGITTANDEVITVTDPASAADVNAIAKLSGAVTATIKDGSVATTLKTLKDVVAGDTITFKTTDKTADANDLVDLAVLVDEDFSSVKTITSKAADIGALGVNVTNALGLATVGNPAVTITNGTISATDAGAISAATDGKVTATITPDTAAIIAGALTAADETDALNITVNGDTAEAANLAIIDGKTALKVKVDATTVTADNYGQFENIYVTNKNNFSSLGDENITVSGVITSAEADIVAKATSKVVSATINGETAASVVTNLKNANAKDELNITVLTDANGTSAKDLIALTKKTSLMVDAIGIEADGIFGSVADINAVIKAEADTKLTLSGDVAYTVTGTVTAAQANAIAGTTTGVVTATIAADTATNLNAALTDATPVANAYTLTVNGATASAATLELLNAKTSEAIKVDAKEITGSIAEVEDVYVTNATDYTGLGNKNVVISPAFTGTAAVGLVLGNLDAILDATTGIVTATLTADSATNLLAATTKATSKDKLTLTVNNKADGTATDAADLLALDAKTSVAVDASSVKEITGSAADIKTVLAAKTITTAPDVAVTITGDISAADANAIAKATDGVVKATIKDGSVASTLKTLKDVVAGDNITFKTTDKTVKATDLVALDSKIANGTYTSIETITGDAKDAAVIEAALAIPAISATNPEVKISGIIDSADITAILTATTGKVTAKIKADTAVNLATNLADTEVNALDVTVNGLTATAAHLNDLAGATAGKITVDAKEITGNITDVTKVFVINKDSFTALGNENVTITGTNTAAQLNTIAAATTGVVTATVTADTAAGLVAALKDATAKDKLTLTVNNDAAATDAAVLLALDDKTAVKVNASAVKDITGTAAEIKKLLASKGIEVDTTKVNIEVTDIASAADVNAIASSTDGAVKATIKDGSVASTLKTLKDVVVGDNITFKTTDKTVKATDLVELKNLVDTFDALNVTTVTGDAKDTADIATALTIATNDPEVKISGIIDSADITAILNATDGKVTAKIKADIATNLVTNLVTNVTDDEVNALDVTVNGGTAAAADLIALDARTSVKVKVDAAEVTGSYTDLETLYVTNKAGFANLGNENVDISGTNSALDVDTILKATTGVVTAKVTGDKANILVSQLKNANAKDDLTIKVSTDENGTNAKDLIALTKKTSFKTGGVDASEIEDDGIVGSVADINAVIKAEADTKLTLSEDVAYTVTGTVTAAQANAIAKETDGAVTATIKADTAANLVKKLDGTDTDDILTLAVNGATATADDLNTLAGVTGGKITVDAKEITGEAADLVTLYGNTQFANLGNKNVKIDNGATIENINTVLGATTGVVTASTTGTAADLVAKLTNATSGKDALTLKVIDGTDVTAAQLLTLDGFTSVKVDATDITTNGITGTAAELKKLLASKGVELAKDVAVTITGDISAADVSAVAKATSGVVTAKVEAGTAAALNKALTDKDVNALTLTVNGTTATAKDLISLVGKTSATTITLDVGAITGNLAEITKVFVENATKFDGVEDAAATISGTITAAEADAVALKTNGVVTATIKADNAAALSDVLENAAATDALKLTVNGTTADAADLVALDGKTSVTVNAAAIKNIEGDAAEVKAAYDANANKTISGLGNETVDLSAADDANVSLVKAINDYTTGVITLDTLNTATDGGNFSLSQLGDLKGITGLVEINAENTKDDIINISLKDLLAANDSTIDFTFKVTGDGTDDEVNVTNDLSGWTKAELDAGERYTYTNDKTGQVVTIVAEDAVINA